MTKLSQRMSKIMDSPKTHQMIEKARAAAKKPENRAKIDKMSAKLRGRTHRHEAGPQGPGAGTPGVPGPGTGTPGVPGPGTGTPGPGF